MVRARREGSPTHRSAPVRNAKASLASHIIDAQDEERRKISRELHDGVGQSLAAVKMSIAKFKRQNSIAENSDLDEALHLLDSTLAEIRTLSHLLHPPNLELLGLRKSLVWLAEGFEQRTGIQTRFEAPEELPPFAPSAASAIFRVAQEALTNVRRHAAASHVLMHITVAPTKFQLEIADDGKGFADLKGCRQGVGILGMQERLAELGGVLRVESGHNAGSSIFVIVPLEAEEPHPIPAQRQPLEGVARILLVDDHPAIRQGVRAILSTCPDLEVCGEASTIEEAVRLVGGLRPDIVLLDLQLGPQDGWSVVRHLRVRNSPAKIIIFSQFAGRAVGAAAKYSGCAGVVSKNDPAEDLIEAIHNVLRGGTSFASSDRLMRKHPTHKHRCREELYVADTVSAATPFGRKFGLTTREASDKTTDNIGRGDKVASRNRRRVFDLPPR